MFGQAESRGRAVPSYPALRLSRRPSAGTEPRVPEIPPVGSPLLPAREPGRAIREGTDASAGEPFPRHYSRRLHQFSVSAAILLRDKARFRQRIVASGVRAGPCQSAVLRRSSKVRMLRGQASTGGPSGEVALLSEERRTVLFVLARLLSGHRYSILWWCRQRGEKRQNVSEFLFFQQHTQGRHGRNGEVLKAFREFGVGIH
jgi:hypothetical protein